MRYSIFSCYGCWNNYHGLKDALAVVVEIFELAQREITFIVPPSMFSIAATSYDTMPRANRFIEHGGVLRGITTVSPANVEETRMRLTIG
ncbi:MAG: hypothetical protein LUP95_02130 [Euryarchaeota archaeon]|nr:hypothetical protein [Euryarchaeota archaeon]